MTGMILIDLEKVFRTFYLVYDILFNKMSAIGFSDRAVDWFKSFL